MTDVQLTTDDVDDGSAEAAPLLSNGKSHTPPDPSTGKTKGFGLFVAICFFLNYSIGAGILGIPKEFQSSGYVLGSVLILFMSLLSYITNIYVVEGILRAEAIATLARSISIDNDDLLSNPESTKQQLMEHPQITTSDRLRSEYDMIRNEYPLSELIGIFAGKWWRFAYDIMYGLGMIVALWDYNVLIGLVLARTIGISSISSACNMDSNANSDCRSLYSLWVCLFFVWSVVVTLINFEHQQWLQVTTTILRMVVIVMMSITSIGLIYSGWYYNGSDYEWVGNDYSYDADNLWNWSDIAYFMAVAAFAYGNQFCIPDIITPMEYGARMSKQHELQGIPVAICGVIYILLGVTVSLYFGSNIDDPCTLSWDGYMGFTYHSSQPIGAAIIQWIVVLLPAVDIGSAFPLNAISMANTTEAMLYFYTNTEYNAKYLIVIKVAICVISSGFALLVWNFELVLALSGAFELLAMYIGPVILEWKSRQFVNDICSDNDHRGDIAATIVTKSWIAHKVWWYLISISCLVAFFAVIIGAFD